MNTPDGTKRPTTHRDGSRRQAAIKLLNTLVFSSLLLAGLIQTAYAQHDTSNIRIAIGDIPGLDTLLIEAAAARARERDINVVISYMQSEDMATQAIINGLADVGIGTPYALIQNTGAPLKLFYQLNTLRFFPVVNRQYYPSWQALDGAPMYTHGKGSGTEAIMQLMAHKQNITYSQMHYVPGSGVRANAMINGRIHATIVDTERRDTLLNHPSGHFISLPIPEISASDEALYGHSDYLKTHQRHLTVLVEELITVSRMVNANPDQAIKLRDRYNLLEQATKGKEDEIARMYTELVSVNAIPNDGGLASAAQADMDFYSASGSLKGTPDTLRIEDFWDFTALNSALRTLERQ